MSGSPSPPYSSSAHDDAGSAVTLPPPPVDSFFPPQPAATRASTPTTPASSPSNAYLLKMDTSVARSLGNPRKNGKYRGNPRGKQARTGLSPEPRAMPKVGVEPTRASRPTGF